MSNSYKNRSSVHNSPKKELDEKKFEIALCKTPFSINTSLYGGRALSAALGPAHARNPVWPRQPLASLAGLRCLQTARRSNDLTMPAGAASESLSGPSEGHSEAEGAAGEGCPGGVAGRRAWSANTKDT